MDFACPKCKGELVLDGNTKKCINNHSFDRAKAGYYNLLLGVKGGTHGDNAEMVEARRDFLSRGYYEPLANRLAELVVLHTLPGGCVLDAGCGEGYYSARLADALQSPLTGLDISKEAVRCAAAKYKGKQWLCATASRIPVAEETVAATEEMTKETEAPADSVEPATEPETEPEEEEPEEDYTARETDRRQQFSAAFQRSSAMPYCPEGLQEHCKRRQNPREIPHPGCIRLWRSASG